MMFFDKKLRSHQYEGKEKVKDLFDESQSLKLGKLIYFHSKKVNDYSHSLYTEFLNQIYVHFDFQASDDVIKYTKYLSLKDLFLLIETLTKIKLSINDADYRNRQVSDFTEDINNFFLLEKVPLQLVFIKQKNDFYIEKIIDDVHSEKIKETLEHFSKYKKIHEDFKKAITLFSSGDYTVSIEKCCVSIEDYFCIILDKQSCQSITSDYEAVSKKFQIPSDINERLKTLINLIHSYRSKPLHGSKDIHNPSDSFPINQLIIGFTMTILNYLHNIFEK